jgi:hypothetical protein
VTKRERKREGETDRQTEGGTKRVRKRERDVEYGCFVLIFNKNDRCLGTF